MTRRTLVYKRTHLGDPNERGEFGCYNCMGRVRSWGFEAVIGIGGCGEEPKQNGIARKVNWIGVGPKVVGRASDGHPILQFERFRDFAAEGGELPDVPRALARRMYGGKVRATMRFGPKATEEIERLLKRAPTAPAAVARRKDGLTRRRACRSVC